MKGKNRLCDVMASSWMVGAVGVMEWLFISFSNPLVESLPELQLAFLIELERPKSQ